MAASNYLEQRIIDFVLNSNTEFSFTAPVDVYVGLYTSSPEDDDSGTELTASQVNYVRVVAGAFSAMTGVTDGESSNLVEIVYPTAGAGGWGTPTHMGVHDALTGGNLLYHSPITTPKAIAEGDTARIAIGGLVITHS